MELSYNTIQRILEPHDWETCSEYGEPGYSTTGTTPLVVLGNYWCRCDKVEGLHSYETHHPKVWEQMARQGVEFEWDDEWTIDYDNDKAYRVSGDSYSWQSSIRWTEHGDLLTPDDDLATWLEVGEYIDNPNVCLLSRVFTKVQLVEAGFESWDGTYENGWHEGMTDDPNKITEEIRGARGNTVEIVFLLDEASQFYIGFSAWTRDKEEVEEV